MATDTPLMLDDPAFSPESAEPTQQTDDIINFVRKLVQPFASLRLTVTLFALSIFLVFASTLAQVELDIWDVVHQYFRTWFAYIEFQVFFPPAFFPGEDGGPLIQIPGGIYFPGGWLLGGLLAINLLAAHLFRFKPQVRDTSRLLMGSGTILLGLIITLFVILSGSDNNGLNANSFLSNDMLWKLLLTGMAILWLSITSSIVLIQKSGRKSSRFMTVTLTIFSVALGALLAWLLVMQLKGQSVQLGDSSMRILWQLIKATVAGVILLIGCVMVFKKRGGIVLIHFGVSLLMFSELLVGLLAVEGQMQLDEGQASNYVSDIRTVELAVSGHSTAGDQQETTVVIPRSILNQVGEFESKNGISRMISEWRGETPSNKISHELLPFDIRVEKFYQNASLTSPKAVKKNLATAGRGLDMAAVPAKAGTGVDTSSAVDQTAAYITLTEKTGVSRADSKPKVLGTWLVALGLDNQKIVVGDQTYELSLRFKRMYRPYTIKLVDIRQDNYISSNITRNYTSTILLYDQRPEATTEEQKSREVDVWMNNPLRFAEETFYQSSFGMNPRTRKEFTSLSVVSNFGWMIPYVSCMLVAVGLMYHFAGILLRFSRRIATAQQPVHTQPTVGKHPQKSATVLSPSKTMSALLSDKPPAENFFKRMLPLAIVLLFGLWFASKARPPKPLEGKPSIKSFAELPMVYDARVKPFDSFARNNLLVFSKRSEVTYKKEVKEGDEKKKKEIKISAAEWLMDLVIDREQADKYRIFRIENLEVQKALDLPKRKGMRYSFSEMQENLAKFEQRVKAATKLDPAKLDTPQKKMIELYQLLRRYNMIRDAFSLPPEKFKTSTDQALYAFEKYQLSRFHENAPLAVPQPDVDTKARADKRDWESLSIAATKIWLQQHAKQKKATTPVELATAFVNDMKQDGELDRFVELSFVEYVIQVMQSQNPNLSNSAARQQAIEKIKVMPPALKATFTKAEQQKTEEKFVQNISQSIFLLMGDTRLEDPTDPFAAGLLNVIQNYKAAAKASSPEKIAAYEKSAADYTKLLASNSFSEMNLSKVRFESFFNQLAPFYYPAFLYIFAFLLAMFSLMFWRVPLGRSALWLIVFTFAIHTFAVIARMYISGRPPVTNLYASAVFIGWGSVLAGIVIELIFRLGIGNILAAVTGAATLGIAHFLSVDGDTITVMQAVLDTQFWLATHVVCITLGYAATFVAGVLGVMFILAGVFSPSLTASDRKALYSITYGILCFAIFFSFVGTVLGGLWADDSWGRFWGWDPKENGALIIVLWNALVLHARWGALVKERGLAVLVVAGNIVTGWSWFGVNELGVGLHSYGFTEGVMKALGLFIISQLVIMAIGLIPKEYWRSYRSERTEKSAIKQTT